ncbi:MAG: DEAD/DEAH box helicase family protein, partial [Pseudomonadota bacterium]|nr:DEAD/DEAH box helicase family protein [Pseudomonadota bacterium]
MQATRPVLRVALPLPLPLPFDYAPPPGIEAASVQRGQRILVPFGARELYGVVVGHALAEPGIELKAARSLLDAMPLLDGELFESLQWLSQYLHAPLGEVLATALPSALRRGEPLPETTRYAWALTEGGRTALPAMRAGKPQALANWLASENGEEVLLDAAHPGWRAPMRTLRDRGLVERVAIEKDETGTEGIKSRLISSGPFSLNEEQRTATEAIDNANGFAPFLLDGVTGSGKTEVYLHAIHACLSRGKQALVLVPEIGLTPQLLQRFRARLGVPVDVLHSGLGDTERARTWMAA